MPLDPKPIQSISPAELLALLQLAGEYAPVVLSIWQKLVAILNQTRGTQAAPACPNEGMCKCCDETIEAQLQALAAAIRCRQCCATDTQQK